MLAAIEDTGRKSLIYSMVITTDAARRTTNELLYPNAPYDMDCAPRALTATYGEDNRLASFNGTLVAYDRDGNMRRGPAPDFHAGSFFYDARNQLSEGAGASYAYGSWETALYILHGKRNRSTSELSEPLAPQVV